MRKSTTRKPLSTMAVAIVIAALVAFGVGALRSENPLADADDAPQVAVGEPSPVTSDVLDPTNPAGSPGSTDSTGSTGSTGTTVPDPAVTALAAAGTTGPELAVAALAAAGPATRDAGGGERLVVPGWLPEGFKPNGGQNSLDPNPPASRITIWRNPSSRLGAPSLLMVTASDDLALAPWIVLHLLPENSALPTMSRATRTRPGGVAIYLFGLGLSTAELNAAASVITAKATNASDGAQVGPLNGGLALVADYGPSAPIRGTTLYYDQGGDNNPQLIIQTGGPRQVGLELLPFTVKGPFEPTSIRGHDGYLVADIAGRTTSYVWLESPGQVVAVSGYKMDVETTRRVIDNLHTLPAAEWEAQTGLHQETTTPFTGH